MCHRCTQNWAASQKCGTTRPAGRAGCEHAWLGRKVCGAPRLRTGVLVPSSAYPWTGMRGSQVQFDRRKCGGPGAAVTRTHSLRSRFLSRLSCLTPPCSKRKYVVASMLVGTNFTKVGKRSRSFARSPIRVPSCVSTMQCGANA